MVSWTIFLSLSIAFTSIYFYCLYYTLHLSGSQQYSQALLSISGGFIFAGLVKFFLGSKSSLLYSIYRKGLRQDFKVGNDITIFGKANADDLVYSQASQDRYIFFCNGFDRQPTTHAVWSYRILSNYSSPFLDFLFPPSPRTLLHLLAL